MNCSLLPQTVNIHSLIPCNLKCGYCYAGFASAKRSRIPQPELHEILRQISKVPLLDGARRRKVTFAGGEPLLSSTIVQDIAYASRIGLVTSLVTNGTLLTESMLDDLSSVLDWLTISIDSLDPETNRKIGRAHGRFQPSESRYLELIDHARSVGIRVKINTVVSRMNEEEDFRSFIRRSKPLRWKVFQVTRIEGENGCGFGKWDLSDAAFERFVSRHDSDEKEGVVLVPESQTDIYGSYAMIGPNGCFFDNSKGVYRYSQPIAEVGIEEAFSEIEFSPDKFAGRSGDYDLKTGLNRGEAVR